MKTIREKDFKSMRKWIGLNSSTDPNIIMRKLYDTAYNYVKPESIPMLVMILAEYQYKSAFVVDQEINLAACMTTIMADCELR